MKFTLVGPGRRWCLALLAAGAMIASAGAAERNYHADLATLYNEYQRVLALRDACITHQPVRRDDFRGAYQDWLNRHERIVDDLDNRFAAIVKRASKNQAEYTKNYGKYQAEVLQLREETKKAMLANKEQLTKECKEFPAWLRHPKSDIPQLFPVEFKSIYRVR